MQIIAKEAGASKETLYRHFGSKEELFSAVIRSRSARITGGNEGELSVEASPRDILFDLGLNLLRFLVSPNSLSLYRAIVTEIPREPELGRIFYTQGPARLLNQFARYLASATLCGKLCCPEPELAAKLFLGAIVANYQLRGLLSPDEDLFSDQKIRAHVNEAVNMFLARYDGCLLRAAT
jgi:TetR/AcrR family transcriptional regulator, mexJK operon transcriptional repressor